MEIVIELAEGKDDVLGILQKIGERSTAHQLQFDKSDARRALSGTPGNTLHSYWMILNILSQQNVPPGEEFRYIELLKFLRGSILVGFYSTLENCLRAIWAHFQGASYDTNTFDGIVRGLLKKLDLQKYQGLLDTCRTLRNAVHNNYVYRGAPKIIEWKSVKGECKDGQPLDLFSAKALHFLLGELWLFAADLLSTRDVLAPDFISLGGCTEGGVWNKHNSDGGAAG